MTDSDMQVDMGNIGIGDRGFTTEAGTVTSVDGTTIAYERSGTGPPVVVVGGGLNVAVMFSPLVEHLSRHFTVYNVDRRGRGHSTAGRLADYSIELEIADLAAVCAHIGEPCAVFANCTGGMIAVPAVARDIGVTKLALYEPPYCAPKVSADYMDRLTRMITEDRRTDAVSLFYEESVGFPPEAIAAFRHHPFWQLFESIAPTTYYDSVVGQYHGDVPVDLLPGIDVPTLVVYGGESPPWIQEACVALADGLPAGEHVRAEGEGHIINQLATAPLLVEFFRT